VFIGLKSGRRSAAIPPAVELTQEALHVIGTFGGEVAEFIGVGLEVEEARREATWFVRRHRARLFDLKADPYELRDLAAERPEDVKRLMTQLDGWWTGR